MEATRHLRAGPLSALLDPSTGFVRCLYVGRKEILRGIYCAVRDEDWGTPPPQLISFCETTDAATQAHVLRFEMRVCDGRVDFGWTGKIVLQPDSLTYSMHGVVHAPFRTRRTGFCVLHGHEYAGAPCQVQHVDGSVEEGRFPDSLFPSQPFFALRAITTTPRDDLKVTVLMEGDTFEMEDQRNYTDASFKTYCTPQSPEGAPARQLMPEDCISQRITVKLEGPVRFRAEVPPPVKIVVDPVTLHRLPQVGTGHTPLDGPPLTPTEAAALRALPLAHIRVPLPMGGPWRAHLERGLDDAAKLDLPLELALTATGNPVDDVRAAMDTIARGGAGTRVVRWLVSDDWWGGTPRPETLAAVRSAIAGTPLAAPVHAATAWAYITLNRNMPPPEACDGLGCGLYPTIHLMDDRTLCESLIMHREIVEDARKRLPGHPLALSPIALRHNPGQPTAPGRPPAEVDPRQRQPLAALWLLGSLKQLGHADAASATYFATAGWRGFMERECGPQLPSAFPSSPGERFPVMDALALLGGFNGGRVLHTTSSLPMEVDSLAIETGTKRLILLMNYTQEDQYVELWWEDGRMVSPVMCTVRRESRWQSPAPLGLLASRSGPRLLLPARSLSTVSV